MYRSIGMTIRLHKLAWSEYSSSHRVYSSKKPLLMLDRVILFSSDSPLNTYSHRVHQNYVEYTVWSYRGMTVEFRVSATLPLGCTVLSLIRVYILKMKFFCFLNSLLYVCTVTMFVYKNMASLECCTAFLVLTIVKS